MIGTVSLVGRRAAVCAGILVALFLPAAGEEPPAAESWKKTTRQWIETVAPGKRLLLVNPHGDVYVRFGGYENRVEIVATIQRLEPSLPPLTVAFRQVEAGLDATVGPEGSSDPEFPAVPGIEKTRDRVDLAVFVPKGVALHVRTGEGRMEIKGLESDLDAESVKGDIRIAKIKGRVQARSERGAIVAMLEAGATAESQELTTSTGDITVHLWEDAKATVRIATSGEIATDYSLQVERRRFEEPGKHAVAVVGEGGPELSLLSKRGNVRLLWQPRHFKREDAAKPAGGPPAE